MKKPKTDLVGEKLFGFVDCLCDNLMEAKQSGDHFITAENLGIHDIGFAQAYLNNTLGVCVLFDIGDRNCALIVWRGGAEPDASHLDSVAALNFFNLEPIPVGDKQNISVLVRVSETFERPYREVVGLGRLYFVNNERSKFRPKFFNLFKRTGASQLLLIYVDRKVDAGIGFFGSVPNFAGGVIKAGQQCLDNRSREQHDISGNSPWLPLVADSKFVGFSIVITPNCTWLH